MYEVTIDNFQGPLDLLLHLIKEAKMDIFNIQLEVIIDEYLDYIRKMSELKLDVASSYLVMSCELVEIKSKMLLPKNEEEKEEEDPKEKLINRLIEYQKYKDQINNFKQLEYERSTYYTKVPSNINEYKSENTKIVLNDITLDDLVSAFNKFLERNLEEEPLNTKITKKEISVADKMDSIKKILAREKIIKFFDLFDVKNRENVVVTFLAILELAKKNELLIKQDDNFSEIICEALYE